MPADATADALIAWLEQTEIPQREKVAILREQHVAAIRNLYDDDHLRVVRAIRKSINSKKLVAEVRVLIGDIEREREPNPRPAAPALPPPLVIAEPPPPSARPGDDLGAALAAAITADPDLRDHYLVYGDWLASQGEPARGQLVTIGAELAKSPGHRVMRANHVQCLADHGKEILGPLAGCDDLMTGVEWYMGFIKKCRIAWTHERFNSKQPFRIPDVIGWLVDEPGPGRFVQDLTVGIVQHDENTYASVGEVLARRPRPSLRRLFLGDFEREETELNWSTIGDISTLWPAVPNLRALVLKSGSMTLGAIDLPKLEKLETICGGMGPDAATSIGHARWPALREIAMMIGPRREGAASKVETIEPLLAGTHAPALRHLGILNCSFTDDVCRVLADSALPARLDVIDLSMGTMSDDGARALAAARERLAHLKLIVDDNYLTGDGEQILKTTVRELVFGGQRDDAGDPDDRYASMYE